MCDDLSRTREEPVLERYEVLKSTRREVGRAVTQGLRWQNARLKHQSDRTPTPRAGERHRRSGLERVDMNEHGGRALEQREQRIAQRADSTLG
jgi:hypothetical protein